MSANQAKVQLHEKSPTDGALIMVGKDGIGVRVNAFQLKAHSSVFRTMLDIESGDTEIAFPTPRG